MTLSVYNFVRMFFINKKKYKSTMFNFIGNTMFMGECVIAVKQKDILLLNDTVDMPEVNRLKEFLIEVGREFKYTIIFIPFKYGEEVMPNNAEIKKRLEDRLTYYLTNTQELVNNKIREEYKANYKQFKKFLSTISEETVNSQLQALYNSLNDKEFLKRLQYQIAKRKSYMK